jgi:anaerobic ribonucleoside-triphosphate reductase
MKEKCPKCEQELEEMELSQADAEKAKEPAGRWYVCHNCRFASPACEIWSRVVGYLRPIQNWNKGKVAEFEERKEYKLGMEDKNANSN